MADKELGHKGAMDVSSATGHLNANMFLISQMLNLVRTNMLVKVVAVDDPGGTNVTGTVDVQPLVNQLDGFMNTVVHNTVYALTYFRLQGGLNAFVVCPQVGDIGMAAICDRDSSSVIANKAQANPGSLRKHDMSDGIYFGGMLNAVPLRYVMIKDTGVYIEGVALVQIHGTDVQVSCETAEVSATTSLTVTSPTSTFNGDIHCTGTIAADVDVLAAGHSGAHHSHSDPQGGNVSPPVG